MTLSTCEFRHDPAVYLEVHSSMRRQPGRASTLESTTQPATPSSLRQETPKEATHGLTLFVFAGRGGLHRVSLSGQLNNIAAQFCGL